VLGFNLLNLPRSDTPTFSLDLILQAVEVFENIVNGKYFKNSVFVLFLNKVLSSSAGCAYRARLTLPRFYFRWTSSKRRSSASR
jgi:hypothetical protein